MDLHPKCPYEIHINSLSSEGEKPTNLDKYLWNKEEHQQKTQTTSDARLWILTQATTVKSLGKVYATFSLIIVYVAFSLLVWKPFAMPQTVLWTLGKRSNFQKKNLKY